MHTVQTIPRTKTDLAQALFLGSVLPVLLIAQPPIDFIPRPFLAFYKRLDFAHPVLHEAGLLTGDMLHRLQHVATNVGALALQ